MIHNLPFYMLHCIMNNKKILTLLRSAIMLELTRQRLNNNCEIM